MKRKILTLLLIAMSLIFIFSCGGGDDNGDDNGEYKTVKFVYGANNSHSDNLVFHEDGRVTGKLFNSTKILGYKLVGFFTEDGIQYFDNHAGKLDGILIDRDMTVYARYELENYTFKFDAQAGMLDDGSNKKDVTVNISTDLKTAFPSATNSNPKFEFDGWFNEDGSVRYTNGTTPINESLTFGYDIFTSGEITFYARFKTRYLSVDLDFNDGVSPVQTIYVEYGKPIGDLSAYYIDNGTQDIAAWSSISYGELPLPEVITQDVRIYAVWKEYKNAVFVYGVGDERTVKVHMTPGESSTLPLQVNPGYNFEGWYLTSTLSGNPVESVPYGALANKYYGKWSVADYTLSFDAGTGEVIDSIIYHYKDTTLLPEPIRDGYTFDGWYYDIEENAFKEIPRTLWGDKQLFAKWTANKYKVTLDTNGGMLKNSDVKLEYGSTYTLEIPNKYGNTFLGWFDNEGVSYTNEKGEALESFKCLNDVSLEAKYKVSEYKVSFTVDGNEVDSKIYEHANPLNDLYDNTPSKNGLFFDGWYNEDFTKQYTSFDMALSEMTLYAKFVESIGISTAEDLNKIRENPSAKYHLIADINLMGAAWTPIDELTGVLDGQGHKIFNFNISESTSTSKYVGLFRKNSGEIKNLIISDFAMLLTSNVKENGSVVICAGAIVGSNTGKIIECIINDTVSIKTNGFLQPISDKADVFLQNKIGSIAGENAGGTIYACSSYATLTAVLEQNQINYDGGRRPTGKGTNTIAGIVAYNEAGSTVAKCEFGGEISVTGKFTGCSNGGYLYGYNHAGGITCHNYGDIFESASNGDVTVIARDSVSHNTWDWDVDTYASVVVGGISTSNFGKISRCTSSGALIGENNAGEQTGDYKKLVRMGGIASLNENAQSIIENCWSSATVRMQAGSDRDTGGLVGTNNGQIKNSYSMGNVTATSGTAGGFVGVNASTGTIMNCFSLGDVAFTSTSGTKGIFVATNNGMISSCYASSEAKLTQGGAEIASNIITGLTLISKNDILNWEFIYKSLYWDNTVWLLNDYTVELYLYFEIAMR